MRTLNYQKKVRRRDIKILKFDPAVFESMHVPNEGLTSYKAKATDSTKINRPGHNIRMY